IVPGKPDQSRLVRQIEGTAKPKMPPSKARQPKPDEIALVRAWVAAGARDDTGKVGVVLPSILPRPKPPSPLPPPPSPPASTLLAAGGQHEIVLVEPKSGEITGRLTGQKGKVTAITFNRAGDRLALASGDAGSPGEIRLYRSEKDTWTPAGVSMEGHAD